MDRLAIILRNKIGSCYIVKRVSYHPSPISRCSPMLGCGLQKPMKGIGYDRCGDALRIEKQS